jgi:hypothetical protein
MTNRNSKNIEDEFRKSIQEKRIEEEEKDNLL